MDGFVLLFLATLLQSHIAHLWMNHPVIELSTVHW